MPRTLLDIMVASERQAMHGCRCVTAWPALLEKAGWQGTQASGGEAAWARFLSIERRWDVALTGVERCAPLQGLAGVQRLLEQFSE